MWLDSVMYVRVYLIFFEQKTAYEMLISDCRSDVCSSDLFLAGEGLNLERTKVGDRYVLETMRAKGFNAGGEQSGHIILTDYATTGEGLIASLHVLAELVVSEQPASELLRLFDSLPQLLKNVRFDGDAQHLEACPVKAAIATAEARIHGTGRLVIRNTDTT